MQVSEKNGGKNTDFQAEFERLQRENKENEVLISLNREIALLRDKNDLSKVVQNKLKKLFAVEDVYICLLGENNCKLTPFLRMGSKKQVSHPHFEKIINSHFPISDEDFGKVLATKNPAVFDIRKIVADGNRFEHMRFLLESGLVEGVSAPLFDRNKIIGAFTLFSEKNNTFQPESFRLIQNVSSQLSIAVVNILANEKIANQLEEINRYRQQLEEENLFLQKEINLAENHSEIIGSSEAMQKVFQLISQVASSDSTVLITGETGTGKELIARAIHNSSTRKNKLMVKVNCAALPSNLIESELFGHEKGAFTGATERRIGKFELANNGTVFLDEIGEIPLELQAKLLCVLQEKEIERIGGKTPIKVNVRVIAATNRNLQKEVSEGRFRTDLFFRLNVFPINLPPLRERKADIPLLASHFISRYAKKTGKKITGISHQALADLMTYNWAGNVRELEHLIERSILLNSNETIKKIHLPSIEQKEIEPDSEDFSIKSLDENERDYILKVLKSCRGKVSGANGAAHLLGVPTSTLNSKMKKLGIHREHIFSKDGG